MWFDSVEGARRADICFANISILRMWRNTWLSSSLDNRQTRKMQSLRVAIKYYADVAELADAQDLGSCALVVCRFDSCHPHYVAYPRSGCAAKRQFA